MKKDNLHKTMNSVLHMLYSLIATFLISGCVAIKLKNIDDTEMIQNRIDLETNKKLVIEELVLKTSYFGELHSYQVAYPNLNRTDKNFIKEYDDLISHLSKKFQIIDQPKERENADYKLKIELEDKDLFDNKILLIFNYMSLDLIPYIYRGQYTIKFEVEALKTKRIKTYYYHINYLGINQLFLILARPFTTPSGFGLETKEWPKQINDFVGDMKKDGL